MHRSCVLILLGLTLNLAQDQRPCEPYHSVNISDAIEKDNGSVFKDGVLYPMADYYTEEGVKWGCPCNTVKCIRKCCPLHQTVKNNVCSDDPNNDFIGYAEAGFNVSLREFFMLYANKCSANHVNILPDSDSDLILHENGSLFVVSFDAMYNVKEYCVDIVDNKINALLCEYYDEALEKIEKSVLCYGMIISMPFLAITFLVYLIIPDKNLHRKALMFYVLSLLLSYVFLVTVQLHNDEFEEVPCHLLGYLIMFFFLASFFWMNVMCIDMWLAFSGWKGFASKRSSECKRFIYYSIYAWGLPGLHVFVVWLLNTHWMSDSEYHPQLGVRKCFLEDGLPVFFYFYFPMAILIGINIVLFAVTILKIRRVKKDTRMLKHTDSKRHSYEDDKQQQFRLYLKLMFAMGVNWIMEIVSWACLWRMKTIPTWVWYLTDLTNALYGVFIFFIFVAKKNIWKSLKKRYYVCIGKPYTAHSIVTSQTTRTSNVSSTDPGEHRMISLRN